MGNNVMMGGDSDDGDGVKMLIINNRDDGDCW